MNSPVKSEFTGNGFARFGAIFQLSSHAIMLIGWKQRLGSNYPTG